jgi:hypothetical protein
MTDIIDAHVVEDYAPCGGFRGWRVEYTHADGSTTYGPTRWLSMYANHDIVEAKRAAGLRPKITDRQRAAEQRLIEQHVTPGHCIIHKTTKTPWIGSHVYVRCIARREDDETEKSGFHVRIGARGAVKHLK